MPPALQKLAALGAYGVSAGLLGLLVFLCWLMWPNRAAGMNVTGLVVGILCAAVPIGIMIVVHVLLGRQLEAAAKGRT